MPSTEVAPASMSTTVVTASTPLPSHELEVPVSDDVTDDDDPQSPDMGSQNRAVLREWSPGRDAQRGNVVVCDAATPLSPTVNKSNAALKTPSSTLHAPLEDDESKENKPLIYDSDSEDNLHMRAHVRDEYGDEDEERHLSDVIEEEPGHFGLHLHEEEDASYARGEDGEFGTFDPISALLDEHWNMLHLEDPAWLPNDNENGEQLRQQCNTPAELVQPIDPALIDLLGSSTNLSAHTAAWQAEFAEIERQLREAIRDADAVEASRERSAAGLSELNQTVDEQAAHIRSLVEENEAAAREITVLQEGIATLQAAHEVDARMNALIIGDQAEEIRELREKLEATESDRRVLEERLRDADSDNSPPWTSTRYNGSEELYGSPRPESNALVETQPAHAQVAKRPTRHLWSNGSSQRAPTLTSSNKQSRRSQKGYQTREENVSYAHQGCTSESGAHKIQVSKDSTSMRLSNHVKTISPERQEQMAALQERKDSLFKDYERKHSMTIEHVVRRTSQLSLGALRKNSRALQLKPMRD